MLTQAWSETAIPRRRPVSPTTQRPSREVMDAVQRSCRAVADHPVRLAEVFYRHLFVLVPSARSMFADDMTDQMQKMTTTLLAAIEQLTTSDTTDLERLLHKMGADHYRRYGVRPEQYIYVGHAFTRAVREVATLDYDSFLSSSWVALCQWVSAHMIAGARRAMAEERAAARQAAAAAAPAPQAAPAAPVPSAVPTAPAALSTAD